MIYVLRKDALDVLSLLMLAFPASEAQATRQWWKGRMVTCCRARPKRRGRAWLLAFQRHLLRQLQTCALAARPAVCCR